MSCLFVLEINLLSVDSFGIISSYSGGFLFTFFIVSLIVQKLLSSIQFSSVIQSYPTLCDAMNHSTSGLPGHHHPPEFTQTHVHRPFLSLPESKPAHLAGRLSIPTNPILFTWGVRKRLLRTPTVILDMQVLTTLYQQVPLAARKLVFGKRNGTHTQLSKNYSAMFFRVSFCNQHRRQVGFLPGC